MIENKTEREESRNLCAVEEEDSYALIRSIKQCFDEKAQEQSGVYGQAL